MNKTIQIFKANSLPLLLIIMINYACGNIHVLYCTYTTTIVASYWMAYESFKYVFLFSLAFYSKQIQEKKIETNKNKM